MRKLNALLTPQFVVYIAGGILCALIDIGVMQLMLANKYALVTSASSGFLSGLLINYVFHARVTFKNVTDPASFARYMCVVGINYMITIAIVSLGVAWWQSALLGKVVSLPIIAMNGFFLSKYWIYK